MWDYLGYTYNTVIIYISAFITTYWPYLVLLALFALYALLQPQKTKALLSTLMLTAERRAVQLALDTGQAKMDFVVENAYTFLPPIVRFFVSKEMLRVMAQRIFDEAKEHVKTSLDPDTPEHDDITPIEPEEPPEAK